MEVDIIGIDNICEFIKNTGLTKFCIDRPGSSRGTLPIFEIVNCNSNNKAIDEFRKFARIANGNMPYKLTLFDKVDSVTDEAGNERLLKSKAKDNKAEVYFKLNANDPNINTSSITGISRDQIYKEVIDQVRNEQKIVELENKIQQLIDQSNEEEEEEEIEPGIAGIPGLSLNNLIAGIQAIKMLSNGSNANIDNKPPQINGVNITKDQIVNINKAIGILAKHDDQIDTDLLKLSDLAENQPGTFKMLLTTLRNM